MAKDEAWQDEYWLLLIKLYLKKPEGVKHLYSRSLVDVALELHVHPRYIHQRMFELRHIASPRLQKLWDEYAGNPRKLSRAIKLLRKMSGFGNAEAFYAGVEVEESWEKDFKPIALLANWSNQTNRSNQPNRPLTPVMLILILDLYFRLTPITMIPETPEIQELAKLIHITPREVADVMDVYQVCDPYITHEDLIVSPLLTPCMEIWRRYGNEDPEKLAALAAQLKEYFTLR